MSSDVLDGNSAGVPIHDFFKDHGRWGRYIPALSEASNALLNAFPYQGVTYYINPAAYVERAFAYYTLAHALCERACQLSNPPHRGPFPTFMPNDQSALRGWKTLQDEGSTESLPQQRLLAEKVRESFTRITKELKGHAAELKKTARPETRAVQDLMRDAIAVAEFGTKECEAFGRGTAARGSAPTSRSTPHARARG